MTPQRIGKYACLEIERRYLLRDVPADLVGATGYWRITDRYILNTRLRLRQMRSADGEVVLKLGQKFRAPEQEATHTTMTNFYLNPAEFEALAQLAANELVKRRYRYAFQGRTYSIDVFEGHLAGLILAEVECESDEACTQLSVPPFVIREVTDDAFFSGGALVLLSVEVFRREFAKRL